MLPVVLDPNSLAVGLAGAGEGLARRRALLERDGIAPRQIGPDAADAVLRGLSLLYVAGLGDAEARALAGRARAMRVLVNVEDVPELCDFHVPAAIRRGDLLLTVSTGGKAPSLARVLREWLAARFGEEWKGRLDEVETARTAWRAAGRSASQITQDTRALAHEKGWLS